MKIIVYSDLHLEFDTEFLPPKDSAADLMILAGDIITFGDYSPLAYFLKDWKKPVLYVTGNHEYYNQRSMRTENMRFRKWLAEAFPNVTLLQDKGVTIDGVHFFGGTMWTDFSNADECSMETAQRQMNDFRRINHGRQRLKPIDTIAFHNAFVEKLLAWFKKRLSGKRVVVTHHAPAVNPRTKYGDSSFCPAFNSLDMPAIIKEYQPALWIYGHTHECDDQTIGSTRIISNQLGYPNRGRGYECQDFDEAGLLVEL